MTAPASAPTPLERRSADLARLVDTTWDVLIVGTAWVLWRISRGRAIADGRPTDNDR